jgi:hypothetical protein
VGEVSAGGAWVTGAGVGCACAQPDRITESKTSRVITDWRNCGFIACLLI